jgi:hypothetical protein
MTTYPIELAKHIAAGLTIPQAQKKIHAEFPGLRRRHEKARSAGQAADAPAAPAEPAAGAKSFETVTDETVRIALGLSKQQWQERRAAKAQDAAPVSNTSTADYFQLIRQERQRTGCNFRDAAIAINKRCPAAWARMLEAANPGRSFQHRIRK